MDIKSRYDCIRVKSENGVWFIQIYRPEANNAINNRLIEELTEVIDLCEEYAKIVVLEGLPDVFCFGADFTEIQQSFDNTSQYQEQNPEPLYDLWLKLASGPFISIAHVRGRVNAGGMGFVAACDVVLSEEKAIFSLSEMLFGLMPACVLPFLICKIGCSKANYLTLMTQPISAAQACEWGLVDACEERSENLLRKHLLRLKRLSKDSISRYKRYVNKLDDNLVKSKAKALEANIEVFSDLDNMRKISHYVKTGEFPWEDN